MRSIEENIRMINETKGKIAVKAGRKPEDVLLVAVTKTRSAEEINSAIQAGITDIGENKVQEILDKYDKVKNVRWHMIGHLQTNKVKYIIDKVALIHSVDSLHLAEEIDRRALAIQKSMDILVQVNPAQEESKFGVETTGTLPLVEQILTRCSNVRIRGLMTIAPFLMDPEEVRTYFRQVRELYDSLSKIKHERLHAEFLSMGMSHDYEVAISEGSNLIRVGTAIFGERG